MKLIGTIFAAALLCGTAQAADKDGKFQVIGAGAITCQKYLETNSNEADRRLTEMWWTGFVTAANLLTSDTWSVVGKDPNARVNEALQKHCKENPNILFAIAVHDVVKSLYNDQHLKAEPKD